jgi:hypothetical protein
VEPIGVESWLCADDDLLYVCGEASSLQGPLGQQADAASDPPRARAARAAWSIY